MSLYEDLEDLEIVLSKSICLKFFIIKIKDYLQKIYNFLL
jgi:hypothetical protein